MESLKKGGRWIRTFEDQLYFGSINFVENRSDFSNVMSMSLHVIVRVCLMEQKAFFIFFWQTMLFNACDYQIIFNSFKRH